MKITTEELAKIVSGTLEGSKDEVITGINALADAQKGDVSFLTNMKYIGEALKTKASAILIPKDVDSSQFKDKILIKVANSQYAYGQILQIIEKERHSLIEIKIHSSASVSENAKIGKNAYVGQNAVIEAGTEIGDNVKIFPNVYIGCNVKIGDDCIFYPNVVIRENTTIGNRSIFQPGVVIGGDGFGFATVDGKTQKVPQIGSVKIGDDVEIGSNSTVDRAVIGVTVIGNGTKIDNLVQMGHNVEIGENCIFVAQAGVAGSTKMGNNVTMGGQSGVVGHLKIGNNVLIASQSGVSGNLKDGEKVGGNPHTEISHSVKVRATMRKLPEMYQDLRKIKKQLEIKE